MATVLPALTELARAYGVETAYRDALGEERHALPETLVRILQVLGAPVQGPDDADAALRDLHEQTWRRPVEPVHVTWDGRPSQVTLRLPARMMSGKVSFTLEDELGERRTGTVDLASLPRSESATVEGVEYIACRLPLPGPLPVGRHRLTLQISGLTAGCLVLSAPTRTYTPPGGDHAKSWGVFLPLYALHSERSWGAGDFTDLQALLDWVHGLGGGVVATLPLLAAFLDEPYEPGPYSPASRLFWNELYLDVTKAPEVAECPAARAMIGSADLRREIDALRGTRYVEHRSLMALKRRVLEELARSLFDRPSARLDALRRYVASHPHLESYARFRAVVERRRQTWPLWPEPLRDGTIGGGDFDETASNYHLYVQWLCEEQLSTLAERASRHGPGLYLDFPLGVNTDSYDVWRERQAFALGMSGGAPPDPFFSKGQNWGFPPLQPQALREQGYRYLTDCLRHHMRRAGVLRIDHLMGLHRLYWVPHGMEAREGAYVRYRPEELYAVFSIESHRHRTVLVGEDLGTVPPEVHPAMERHRVGRMYVVQYEAKPEGQPLLPVPAGAVSSLNTHDMPTFAAYWRGLDVPDRQDLGLLDDEGAREELARRQKVRHALAAFLWKRGLLYGEAGLEAVLAGCLAYLATQPSRIVLASLEDLWQETQPQNTPGTWKERPNWKRKARYSLEEFRQLPAVLEQLRNLDAAMKEPSAAQPMLAECRTGGGK